MNSCLLVAKKYLEIANDQNISIGALKLNTLVYLSHGWSLALNNRPLIDDVIEAWHLGPVIPTLYESVRNSSSIPVKVEEIEGDTNQLKFIDVQLMLSAFEYYKHLSITDITTIAKKRDSPWHKRYMSINDWDSFEIGDDNIKDFFDREMAVRKLTG